MAHGTGLAVVTGSSSGIGREVARAFASLGYRTVLIARRLSLLEDLAADLGRYAPSVPVAVDLSCEEAVEHELSRLDDRFGPVDVLVNCAGHGMYTPFLAYGSDEHHSLMRVHYFAALAAIRATLPAMVARRRGHVITIGSMSAKMGPWGHSGYAAAKAALTALTQSLEAEYGPTGVRFSIVQPGIVDTPYYHPPSLAPLRERVHRWLISPERVARVVIRLVERPRLEVCVPRYYRTVDAIGALSPGLLHRLVAWQTRPAGRTWRPGADPDPAYGDASRAGCADGAGASAGARRRTAP